MARHRSFTSTISRWTGATSQRALRERCQADGLRQARKRARTDARHVVTAIQVLNHLEGVGETLRATLNDVATVAPDWLRALAPPADWLDRSATCVEASRLPKGEAAHQAIAEQIGRNGFTVMAAVSADAAPASLHQLPSMETLRRTWV